MTVGSRIVRNNDNNRNVKSVIVKRVPAADIEISYRQAGNSGPKVVLIHGMAETSDSCWSPPMENLSRQFECYAMDLRGHGGTTIGDADATLEQLGGDLLAFLENVTGPATVAGFSLGGTIALWAAAQQSELIEHVIAIGSSSVISRDTAAFFRDKAVTVERGDLHVLHAQMAEEVGDMFHAHPDKAAAYGARRIASIGEGPGYANAALAMARMREIPLQPELANIKCAVDIVGGQNDKWCPRRASEILLDGLSTDRVRFTEIPRVGHLMTVDEPAAVSELLAQLIQTPPQPKESATPGKETK